jgi:hypothetical protein
MQPSYSQPAIERLEDRLCLSTSGLVLTGAHSIRADFNGDERSDLISTVRGGHGLSIQLGKAGGGFGRARLLSGDGFAKSGALGVGDFNGDGKLDLVVYGGSSTVSAKVAAHHAQLKMFDTTSTAGSFTGIGSLGSTDFLGQIDTTSAIGMGVGSSAIVGIGDIGNPVSLGGIGPGNAIGNIGSTFNAGLLGLTPGSGSFVDPGGVFSTGQVPAAVSGIVPFPNRGLGNGSNNALFGSGAGNLGRSTSAGTGGPLLVSRTHTALASGAFILLGNGDGTFQDPVAINSGQILKAGASSRILVTDFNNDGNLDLILARNGSLGSAQLLLGTGQGTFAHARTIAVS